MNFNRISSRRHLLQIFLLVVLLLVPFLRIGDTPFLQLNFRLRTLFLGGTALRVDELFLLLVFLIVLMLLFFLITTLLGRIWCGWLCPQTVLNDLVDVAAHWLTKPFTHHYAPHVAYHLAASVLSVLLACALLGWCSSPAEVFRALTDPGNNLLTFSVAGVTAVILYLDLILVKREFCRSYCPYGRFQSVLLDKGTLNLAFRQESRERCINCRSCMRACPMGIDIRSGFQIECINCGRCLDACRDVMERSGAGDGLFAYRFGETAGGRPRPGQKTAILALALAIASLTLVRTLQVRSVSTFSLQRSTTAVSRQLPDGSYIQPLRCIIGNRGQSPASFTLTAAPLSGAVVELLGPVKDILIAPNQNRPVDFSLRIFSSPGVAPSQVELRLIRGGVLAATQKVIP